ncbi:flagellar hook-associated protein FlgL [Shewanella schlegeliana]|uniref:Flagellar hook-associated protein FlgL n=1 Tax=Shewanella schlegeliana TaxID=190308 RepID=A0ABS1SW80_9GAMM|nr:flagellar hook-associated protein FlgL [Shewanella schlegeliana]MBL4911571.1 flagellar hook-associated protein FlgL [Shewanella schlegeliana]MCL1111744.1 flagellar hook-associated protein FlgL [Shewanella schlegeliana]GIU36088.1 flagellar hook-associated protein FlgL [Shewanella schlegeliana]
MRISTAQMFHQNINSVTQKQSQTSQIIEQLSTGKRVNTAGDDPVAAAGIGNLNQQNAIVDQFLKNIDYAKNRLSISESKLGSAATITSSVREQVLRAVNGTLTDSDRQTVADEMRGSLEELMAIANSKDESGNYLFSGFNTDSQPFEFDASGNVVYHGDSGVRDSVVASGTTIGANIPGDLAFMNAANGLGDYSVNYLASQTGEFSVESAKVTDPATHVADTYTFNMVGNDLEVRDSSNAVVTTVTAFDPNNPVSFNGIEVKLDGKPAPGDSFTLDHKPEVSLLDTINSAIALIEDPNKVNTPAGQSELAQMLNNIDSGMKQLDVARGVAGNSLKSLDSYSATHEEEKIVNNSALSMLEDLDYAEAITQLEQQQQALNAASSVFTKVGTVSLFDYI